LDPEVEGDLIELKKIAIRSNEFRPMGTSEEAKRKHIHWMLSIGQNIKQVIQTVGITDSRARTIRHAIDIHDKTQYSAADLLNQRPAFWINQMHRLREWNRIFEMFSEIRPEWLDEAWLKNSITMVLNAKHGDPVGESVRLINDLKNLKKKEYLEVRKPSRSKQNGSGATATKAKPGKMKIPHYMMRDSLAQFGMRLGKNKTLTSLKVDPMNAADVLNFHGMVAAMEIFTRNLKAMAVGKNLKKPTDTALKGELRNYGLTQR
jgi:hypothetical protein